MDHLSFVFPLLLIVSVTTTTFGSAIKAKNPSGEELEEQRSDPELRLYPKMAPNHKSLLKESSIASASDQGQKFKRVVTSGCQGDNCPKSSNITPDVFRPTSCLDYLIKEASKCGIYRLYDNAGNSFPAYCDLKSEPGTAWTLVMSWSTQYRSLPAFQVTPLKINAPVNENSHNWKLYRLSLARMRSLQSHSTHWRATCSFPTHGVDFIDYVRGTLKDLNIIDYSGSNICKRVEYINIRGHIGIQQTVPFWQGSKVNEFPLHTDSSFTTCEFKPNSGSVSLEDNFGYYSVVNSKFRCTEGGDSSTQWWFGAHL